MCVAQQENTPNYFLLTRSVALLRKDGVPDLGYVMPVAIVCVGLFRVEAVLDRQIDLAGCFPMSTGRFAEWQWGCRYCDRPAGFQVGYDPMRSDSGSGVAPWG